MSSNRSENISRGGFSGHATVGKEAFGFRTECVLHLDSGVVMRAVSMAADAILSADQAADHLDKQLRRYHRKLKDYHGNARDGGGSDDIALAEAPEPSAALIDVLYRTSAGRPARPLTAR